MEKSCNACSKKINILIDKHYYFDGKYLCFECDERPLCPICDTKGCQFVDSEDEDEELKPLIVTITISKQYRNY